MLFLQQYYAHILAQIENLGMEGRVDEAQSLMHKVDKMRDEREQLYTSTTVCLREWNALFKCNTIGDSSVCVLRLQRYVIFGLVWI